MTNEAFFMSRFKRQLANCRFTIRDEAGEEDRIDFD
jgi:hypothetical protein